MAHKYNMDPSADRWENLTKAQNGTVDELINMLDTHSIALMIRPTGFGKTHLMIDLANREKYEKVLYLYPMDVIKQSIYESYHNDDDVKFADSEDEHIKRPDLPYIEFCTYSKMLEDINNVYRFHGKKEWSKLSTAEKTKLEDSWNNLTVEKQEIFKRKWIKDRFEHIELLILDEAHTCGAEGFMSYWEYIHELTAKGLKANRLHVLGATATILRTSGDKDIEKEIFYFDYSGEKKSSRISDFGMEYCWRYNILKRPYYIRGILDKKIEKETVLKMIENKEKQVTKVKNKKDNIEEDDIDDILLNITPVENVIFTGVNEVAPESVKNNGYIRLLVFHADSQDLIENHTKINNAISNAFINSEIGYKTLNSYYIASNVQELRKSNIEVSKVSVISDKDREIKNNPECGDYTIDVIHSIDMLNMGYHVGKVTGIITRRKTSSEIIYYQQIGRCISVSANNQPLIIDLANAAAELFTRTSDTQREDAVNRIKTFIQGCEQCIGQNEAVDNLYKYMNMHLDMEPLDTELIDFWYFDRHAPIYFLIGISRALGKKDTVGSMLRNISELCRVKKKRLRLDMEFCSGIITRINKNVIKTCIVPQEQELSNINKKTVL